MQSPTRHESPPASIRRSKRLIRRTKPLEAVAGPVAEFETAVASFEDRYNESLRARHHVSIAIGKQHEAVDAVSQARAILEEAHYPIPESAPGSPASSSVCSSPVLREKPVVQYTQVEQWGFISRGRGVRLGRSLR